VPVRCVMRRRKDSRLSWIKRLVKRDGFRLRLEKLEPRQLLASVSAPAILQWFDGSFATIEERTPDIFAAGYGSVWLPPPGRADSGGFSVGYDVYDRFDLGKPDNPTLYGTETGIKAVAQTFDNAAISLQVDTVLNHAGFSELGTPGFAAAGGYPGLAITLPNAIDGDFHSSFQSGDLNGRLAGLVDIDHGTNHQFIRSPVDPNDSRNIPAGTTSAFGRLANAPTRDNLALYPDRDLNPILLFDPTTGESGIAKYPFNPDSDKAGDPVPENALGYQMRYLQWLIQEVGADGLRLDATKHFEPWVLNYLDRAVYRSNPRLLLDGSVANVFSYGEAFTGDKNQLLSYVRKDINPADPGRIGGNRDTLDFSAFFAMKANLDSAGTPNAWVNIRNSLLDLHDDGIHNGSAGVLFVSSHDEHGPSELSNVAQAFVMMYPGNATVYFNGKEFGDNRDFPKDGRGDALGGVYGDGLKRLVQIRNTHGRGNFLERWIDGAGLYVYERESSAVVGLSNRGDNGFDTRTVSVAFAPGTRLVELTGNAANTFIDPFNDIPEVLTVKPDGTIDIRVPRNRNANGGFHGNGYVMYGLPTPQASAGLEIIGATSVLPGVVPAANSYQNGVTRLNDLTVITTDSFGTRLNTNEVRLLGLESLRDVYADGDNAVLRLDGGVDLNGNGNVDFVNPGNTSYGFEFFGNKSSPLIGVSGISGPRGDGEFLQTIDATQLSEGVHYLEARAYRHRTDGGPAVYSEFKEAIYVDRLPPDSAVKSFRPWQVGVNENRNLVVQSVDKTADSVHVFLDLPASMTQAQIRAMVASGNSARRIDRDQFVYGFSGLSHGNHVATIVTFEQTGNVNVQRSPGLFTSTIIGAGLGDVDTDGDIDSADHTRMLGLVVGNNTEFHPAADFDADGSIDSEDYRIFLDEFIDQNRAPIDFGDARDSYLRPYFSDRVNSAGPIELSVPGGNINLQSSQEIALANIRRDDTSTDSLYFRFTVSPMSIGSGGIENAFAGVQLWNDGKEGIGIGNRFGSSAWSYFGAKNSGGQVTSGDLNSENAIAGQSFEMISANVPRTFLMRVQYQAGQDDLVTVWMQPKEALDSGQAEAATTTFIADASFNQLRVRAGSGAGNATWSFSDIRVSKQFKPGPAHLIRNNLRMGFLVDPDNGAQTSFFGNGDDNNASDDEDGILYNSLPIGDTWPLQVGASATGLVDAWIDYNQNGIFEHPLEHVTNGISQGVNLGLQTLNVQVPASAVAGTTSLRIRISSAGGLRPDSYAADGEVEDHQVLVVDPPPAVRSVRVASSDWSGALINRLDPADRLGYKIPINAEQLNPLSWSNLDKVIIEFSEDVSLSLNERKIHLRGVTNPNIPYFLSFDPERKIATLTLTSALKNDRIRVVVDDTVVDSANQKLDGEWTTGSGASKSGNLAQGGRFDFRFDVLPGDVNGNGLVTGGDALPVTAALNLQASDPSFPAKADVNGDGLISNLDAQYVTDHFFRRLPEFEPAIPRPGGLGNLPPVNPAGSSATPSIPPTWNAIDELMTHLGEPTASQLLKAQRIENLARQRTRLQQRMNQLQNVGSQALIQRITSTLQRLEVREAKLRTSLLRELELTTNL
jgi:alpha-amylase